MVNKKENGAVELQNALNQSEAFVLKYKKALLIVVAALAVAVAGFFLYRTYVYLPEEEKASTELAKGQTLFSMEQFEVALNGDKAGYSGFANIAKDHSGTMQATLLTYMQAFVVRNLTSGTMPLPILKTIHQQAMQW